MARDPDINIDALHLRPASSTDALGNIVPNGADAPVAATGSGSGSCVAGVFPPSLRRTPYMQLGGGEIDTRRAWVAVRRAPTVAKGDAIQVLTGRLAGKYRVEVVNYISDREPILALCLKEA